MSTYQRDIVRAFFPTAFGLALLAIFLAYSVLGPLIATKGAYVVIGLTVAAALHYLYDAEETRYQFVPRNPQANDYGKLVFVVLGLAILGSYVIGSRTFVVVLILPICYFLLGLQLWERAAPSWILFQAIALFLVSPITQYLTTGFYFSRGDTIHHVGWVEQVAATGTWQTLPAETFYSSFPGLHTLLASSSVLADIPAYDSYMIVGIITYLVVITTAYCLGRYLFDQQAGVYIALGMTVLTPVIIHSAYLFPQSFFFGLMTILFYVTYRSTASTPIDHVWFSIISAVLVAVLVLSHHLSVILLMPIVGALVIIPGLLTRFDRFSGFEFAAPRGLPFVALMLAAFAYWSNLYAFVNTLVSAVLDILRNTLLASDDSTSTQYIVLGETVPELTLESAFYSLFSPDGIYNALLVGVLAVGVVAILRNGERYRHAVGLLVVGVIGSMLVLRTPLALQGINRMGLPFSLFVAIIAGTGIYRMFTIMELTDTRTVPVLLVFVLLATSAHATAGLDLYGIHSGPDLWETTPMPESQKEFTEQEYRSLEEVTRFINRQELFVSTDWVSTSGILRFNGPVTGNPVVDRNGIEIREGFLLYRNRWATQSQTIFLEDRADRGKITFTMTDAWLENMLRNENKVYTTGEVGLIWDHNRSDYLLERDDVPE